MAGESERLPRKENAMSYLDPWAGQYPGVAGQLLNPGAKAYFVDPEFGAAGNPGTYKKPLATVAAAYALCRTGRGDTVFYRGGPDVNGATTLHTTYLTEEFAWAKDNTHLIGLGAPTMVGQRARFATVSAGDFTPMFSVSGDSCRFENLQFFDGATTNPQCVEVTGQRNYFRNVMIGGMGAATGADDASACSLFLNGGAENTFDECYIGLDTVARSTTNAEIMLEAAATRNIFRRCFIASFADNNGHLFVKIDGSGDMDRFVWFDGCTFYNAIESTGTAMTQAMNVHNTCGGMVILTGCALIGATDWAAADNGNIYIDGTAATAGSDGIMLAVTR